MKMKYKYIIFDFNGTLVDSSEVINESLKHLLAKSRFKNLCIKDFQKTRGLSLSKKIKIVLFFARYQREFMTLLNKNISRIKLVDGVKQVLMYLNREDIKFYILSSNTTDMILKFFKFHNIFVQDVYRSQRLFGKKKIFKKFIKQNRCKPDEVVYVGDEIRDIKACNKSNVDIFFVKWGLDANENLTEYKIKYVAESPSDLYDKFTNVT